MLFDRSWYNRAGVEIVMGFCSPQEYGEFFRQAPGFERSIVESGTHLFKFWFTVSRQNQLDRFERRKTDPLRQWKFSPVDEASLGKWDEYTKARDAMLIHTDSPAAPWIVVNSNEKKRARLESIRHVVQHPRLRAQGLRRGPRCGSERGPARGEGHDRQRRPAVDVRLRPAALALVEAVAGGDDLDRALLVLVRPRGPRPVRFPARIRRDSVVACSAGGGAHVGVAELADALA